MSVLSSLSAVADPGTTYVPWRTLATSVVGAVAFGVSILVRRPLVGVIWAGITGAGAEWRATAERRRPFVIATAVWAAAFAARAVFRGYAFGTELPDADLGWLRVAELVVFSALLVATVFWVHRRFGMIRTGDDG